MPERPCSSSSSSTAVPKPPCRAFSSSVTSAAALPGQFDDQGRIQRFHKAGVDDRQADAVPFLQHGGSLQRREDHAAQRQQGAVAAFAQQFGLSGRQLAKVWSSGTP